MKTSNMAGVRWVILDIYYESDREPAFPGDVACLINESNVGTENAD